MSFLDIIGSYFASLVHGEGEIAPVVKTNSGPPIEVLEIGLFLLFSFLFPYSCVSSQLQPEFAQKLPVTGLQNPLVGILRRSELAEVCVEAVPLLESATNHLVTPSFPDHCSDILQQICFYLGVEQSIENHSLGSHPNFTPISSQYLPLLDLLSQDLEYAVKSIHMPLKLQVLRGHKVGLEAPKDAFLAVLEDGLNRFVESLEVGSTKTDWTLDTLTLQTAVRRVSNQNHVRSLGVWPGQQVISQGVKLNDIRDRRSAVSSWELEMPVY